LQTDGDLMQSEGHFVKKHKHNVCVKNTMLAYLLEKKIFIIRCFTLILK